MQYYRDVEDYNTRLRSKLLARTKKEPGESSSQWVNRVNSMYQEQKLNPGDRLPPKSDNPGPHIVGDHVKECKGGVCECVIRGHPAKHFDPGSFRTMKDQPKPGYYMIVGCPKGEFREGKCQVGTELHKITAPTEKCR